MSKNKDFIYCMIIMTLLLIGVFTFFYGGRDDIVSHMGFGGTVVSILLAVVAIIYSFYQSSTYENANAKLDASASQIQEAANNVSVVKEIQPMLNEFKEEVRVLKEGISNVKEITGRVDTGIIALKDDISKSLISNSKSEDKNHSSKQVHESFFLDFLTISSPIHTITTLICYKSYINR
ncbi:hypothetical protein [Terribacillus aidingensis]|uniref:hypothetical protein n=1 Tax=Terribacillus aidingensis TaxID=586416 RepID=UPI00344D104C